MDVRRNRLNPGILPGLLAISMLSGCELLGDSTGPRAGPEPRCDGSGRVVLEDRELPAAPNGFVAVGNRLLDARTCAVVRFVGVARPSLSFSAGGARLGVDSAAATDFANIRAWGANTVRIELAQFYWLPTARSYDPGYRPRVERVVRQAREAGLHVILALQGTDRGLADYIPVGNTHQPMADRNHSIPFWRDVATRFSGDGGVLFELKSEPFPIGGRGGYSNWEMWRNGGSHPADNVYGPRPAFEAVGMQELYETVRGTGAKNIVIIGGTNWAYRLDGVPANRIRGYNIAYATHPWNHPRYPDANQPATWEEDWAFLAKTDPVIITEFGTLDCKEPYVRALLDRADAGGMSWIAWMWVAPEPGTSTRQDGAEDPICARSNLIMDWAGTPTKIGGVIKERLARYR